VEEGAEDAADLRDGQRDRVAAAGGLMRIGGPPGCRVGGDGGQEGQGADVVGVGGLLGRQPCFRAVEGDATADVWPSEARPSMACPNDEVW
jgi:hypothetical protein